MSTLRFAIIGAGNIAGVHAEALKAIPVARVTVICSRTEARGRALAAACGAEWVADYREAVARADVDVVVVCTPSGTHGEVAVAAARAGRHVVVEKPLEVTVPRVDAIIDAARQAGVQLACVFPTRFRAGVPYVKAAVDGGRLGRLTTVEAAVTWWRPQSYYDSSWRGTWRLDGGGALMNQAIHSVDLLRYLAGPVARVAGWVGTLAHRMETEDTAVAALTFHSGALGAIRAATSAWPGDPARVAIHGERGSIILEEGRIVGWQLTDAAPDEEGRMLALEKAMGSGASDPMGISVEPHRRQLADFVAAVQEGRPPLVDGDEGRHAVEIVRAIYHAAATGQPVALPFADAV